MLSLKPFQGRRFLFLTTLSLWGLFPCGSLFAQSTEKLSETFETGSKSDYAVQSIALTSGSWTLDNAILAGSEQDRKNGLQSVRITQNGKLTMNFPQPTGAGMVMVKHGIYGTGASSAWELWAMQDDNCALWEKVGPAVISTDGALQTALFYVNLSGPVRFEIRKVSGGEALLNIDDFEASKYGEPLGEQYPDNDHMALGNPSGAKTDVSLPANYLMRKPYYALCSDRDRGTPNWVSWHLQASDLGAFDRSESFYEDLTIPAGWYRVQESSYQGSGFNRGHNVPSADRTSTQAANEATFLMTNIIPQAPLHNQGLWGNLENYTRSLLSGGNEIYILMGSYGIGGKGANGGVTNKINNGNVTVPAKIWKVIIVLPAGVNDLTRINAQTRVIAIDTPNDNAISAAWGSYRTSIDAIEKATGLDLLSNLPTAVQAVLESRIDNGPTN